ncbi:hypothetical protein [Actinoplanes xinjiangensis]|uniref:hypothetical protein n=1 Tax=Actinoplanes xinjiangensis TaxID=512350 RepID=UPI0034352D03
MIGRLLSNRYGAAIGGIAIFCFGMFALDGGEVKCGSSVMKPGDECVETRKGNSTTRSFEEQKSHDELFRYGAIGVGALMFVVGTGLIVKRHVLDAGKGDQAVAAGDGYPPVPPQPQPYAQQGDPQQQAYPQQGYPQQGYPQQAQPQQFGAPQQ